MYQFIPNQYRGGLDNEALCRIPPWFPAPRGPLSKETRSRYHKFSILTQLCKILSDLHQHGFVHNDVKMQNACFRLTASDPVVTFIDFGVTMPPRQRVREDIASPDIFRVGQFLRRLFEGQQLPALLNSWYTRSQSRGQSEYSDLSLLVEFVEEQRLSHLCFGR